MQYKIRVDYAEVDVHENSWEEGELDYVNSWDLNYELEDKTFDTVDELIKTVSDVTFCFPNDKNYYCYIDGRIDGDVTVNEDNEEPSNEELEAWKRGELMLYNAHLRIGVTMVPTGMEHKMTEEEAENFGLQIY